MRGNLVAACYVLACGLLSDSVGALTPSLPIPSSGARLQAGEVHAITWSLPEDGEEFEEMELVLSLDGGRSFPIRVSGRIDEDARGWAWRIPSLPTEHARLALRVGRDESPSQERLALVSAEFVIVRPWAEPLAEISLVDGEGRTREALEGTPAPPLSASSVHAESGEDAPTDRPELTTREPVPGFAGLRRGASAVARATLPSATVAPHVPSAAAPVRLPMRL